jgi:quercetin dioxygenase-like cupin family protein
MAASNHARSLSSRNSSTSNKPSARSAGRSSAIRACACKRSLSLASARVQVRAFARKAATVPLRMRAQRVTPPHRHPEGQLFGATRGVLTVGTDAGLGVVPASHAVWVPPQQRYSLRSHGTFDGSSVYVSNGVTRGRPAASSA